MRIWSAMANGEMRGIAGGSETPREARADQAARTAELLRVQDELLEMIAEGASQEAFLERITLNLKQLLAPTLKCSPARGRRWPADLPGASADDA